MVENHPGLAVQTARRRIVEHTYRIALAYVSVVTAVWVYLNLTGVDGGLFFRNYDVTGELVAGIAVGFLVFWVGWSWLVYRLKRFLLRRAGLDEAALDLVFSNRLTGFDLEALVRPQSERTVRVADMICRRGRTGALAFMGFYFVARGIGENPTPESLALGLEANLLEGMVFAWWSIITFHSNGLLGRISYGAQARVMDGIQGRANVLCIGMLWNGFRFVMIPIGFGLAAVFPPETYATVFALIWFSYITCDFATEIVGASFGKQSIPVWGLGDVNRKSVEGTAAGFAAAVIAGLLIVGRQGLDPVWYGLVLALAVTSTLLELYSPRGSDDITMATGNALVCWAFGALVLGG